MMRNFLISGVALAAMSGSAFAADLPSRVMPPPLPLPPIWSWTGFYVGINGGYGGDRINNYGYDTGTGALFQNSAASSGFLGGGQVGYNWQFPTSNVVLGLEADIQASSIKAEYSASVIAGGAAAGLDAGTKIDWFGTVRGRLGYGFGQVLPYFTGGFAYGETKSFAYGAAGFGAGAAAAYSTTKDPTGWTLGAGLEYAITHNLTVKAEYLYVNLGKSLIYASPDGLGGVAALSDRANFNVVRAGLNYKFDFWAPPAPVVARY